MGVELRSAQRQDLEALLALENRCFSGDRISRRSFKHFLKGEHSLCLLAAEGEQLLGYILLLFRRGSSLARVYSLAVDAAARGRGLGRQLLLAAEESALERQCLFVRLEVREDNLAALSLYQHAGYRIFDREQDYYEDGATALRLEKGLAHEPPALNSPPVFYQQTTPFTCGPASLMMAMHSLAPDAVVLERHTELQIWREATTIFMTSGHGGCSPEGLALAAWRRGFAATLYLQSRDVPFIEGVRDPRKKEVIELVHADFMAQIADTDIELVERAITAEDLARHLEQGDRLITLISTWRLNRNKAPHWVFLAGADNNVVYLNDPYPGDEPHLPLHDAIRLPIARSVFEQMTGYGRGKLKATLVVRQKNASN